jgi:hypothetical protein
MASHRFPQKQFRPPGSYPLFLLGHLNTRGFSADNRLTDDAWKVNAFL